MNTDEAMYPSDAKWRSVALQLIADHRAGKHFEPFAADNGISTVAEAYAVQREYIRLQQTASGSSRSGYKIGLTSVQIQKMCGIDNPVYGVITSDRVLSAPVELDGGQFGRLGLEFEIGVRMGNALRPTEGLPTTVEVSAAIDTVFAAIELVDDRFCNYQTLDGLSLVADNSWNAGIVCGGSSRRWDNLADAEGIVLANGVEVGRGFGRDALGHPFIAVAWLADCLADSGMYLSAGDIVMTGSLIKTQFPSMPTYYEFDLAGIGHASCQVNFSK